MRVSAQDLGRYDCLYVTRGVDSVLLSCAGRLLADQARQLRILVILTGGGEAGDALSAVDADHMGLEGIPDPVPRPSELPLAEALSPRATPPEPWLRLTARALDEIGHRTRVRHVYIPLGVGGHAADRWVHEAGLAAFPGGDGRDVLLYEDRPQAFVPGAVRLRLAQLGSRLPPGAASVGGAGLLRLLFRFHRAPHISAATRGLSDRLRTTRILAGQWLASRGWRPQKAFGPRIQPVLQEVGPEGIDAVRALLHRAPPSKGRPSVEQLRAWGRQYARRLGSGGEHAERYWLVLPPREIDRVLPAFQVAAAP